MGIVDRLRRWIDLPPEPLPEPEDWVLLTIVPFHDGPMLQSALEGAGLDARLEEVPFLFGQLPAKYQVTVRQRDFTAGRQILAELRPAGPTPDVVD